MFHLSKAKEGQTFRILRIKGSPAFHRWFLHMGLKLGSVFEVKRVTALIISNEDEEPVTWLEILANGRLIRLSTDEFSCLDVAPCTKSALAALPVGLIFND
ncbi:MAG: FeoA family protein [Dehalogenimonas sp.]